MNKFKFVHLLLGASLSINIFLIYYFASRERGIFSKKHRVDIVNNYRVELSKNKNWIIFLGNSIIDRNNWKESLNHDNILNYGIGGNTTSDVLNRLEEITNIKPRKIFLLIGINDLRFGTHPEELLKNYENILKSIKKECPQTTVYIHSILPIIEESRETLKANNKLILQTNSSIKDLADFYGYQYINIHDSFSTFGQMNANYTEDGLHLNKSGYKLWEKMILGFIEYDL